MRKEDKLKLEADEYLKQITQAEDRIARIENGINIELTQLEKAWPSVLKKYAHGEITLKSKNISRDRAEVLRKDASEITELFSIVNDKELHGKHHFLMHRISQLSKMRIRYDEVKEQLLSEHGLSLVSDLRLYAKHLDEIEDCEQFLSTLRKSA